MTEEQITQLDALADRSCAARVRLQELDDALLALVPAEAREQVRLAMRLKGQFSEYVHRIGDAVEWCERRQSETGEKVTPILKAAAKKFSIKEKSLDHGWIHRKRQALNELLRLRAATGTRRHVPDST